MSASYKTSLSPEVRAVLLGSVITATTVALPNQLARDLYEQVNKALVAAGGKWNRSAKAHVFSRDPREVLGLAVETGSIIDAAKMLQQFFTPPDLAARVVRAAGVRSGDYVLEPSAGEGALADAARTLGAQVYCIEIDPVLAAVVRAKGYTTRTEDFLKVKPGAAYGPFDRIVMNPPFSKGQDMTHVTHALSFLRPGGTLAAIMSAGMDFGTSKKHLAFHTLLASHTSQIEKLAEKSFDESGTAVNTVLVTITT